tara:strand:- start:1374 stop:1787 length:414 start_codon:yes stop_codon:yes gene_type:complete
MEERSDEPQLADIRDHWHWVRDGIQEILTDQEQLTFIPEDVYAACVNNQAQLWIAPEGFVITTGLKDEYARTSTLLIWIAWAEERGKDCVLKYMAFFSEQASKAGYIELEVRTPKPFAQRWLDAGWELNHSVYTRRV